MKLLCHGDKKNTRELSHLPLGPALPGFLTYPGRRWQQQVGHSINGLLSVAQVASLVGTVHIRARI